MKRLRNRKPLRVTADRTEPLIVIDSSKVNDRCFSELQTAGGAAGREQQFLVRIEFVPAIRHLLLSAVNPHSRSSEVQRGPGERGRYRRGGAITRERRARRLSH